MSRARVAVAEAMLWLAVLNGAIWLGGTVFMMLVFNPLWTASPPESVRAYWVDAGFYETIFNFFGPPWQVARALPVVGALVACWPLARQRRLLLVTFGTLLVALALTRLHVYPMNTVLFTPAIDGLSPDAAREMTRAWIGADRLRFVIMSIGFLALLRAFRLPLVPARETGARSAANGLDDRTGRSNHVPRVDGLPQPPS